MAFVCSGKISAIQAGKSAALAGLHGRRQAAVGRSSRTFLLRASTAALISRKRFKTAGQAGK